MKPEDIQFEATVVVIPPQGGATERSIRVATSPPVGKEWIDELVLRLDEALDTLAIGTYEVRIGAFTLIHCVDDEMHGARTICRLLAVPMTGLLASLQRIHEDGAMNDESLIERSAENLTTRIFDGRLEEEFVPGLIRPCVVSGKEEIAKRHIALRLALLYRELRDGDDERSSRTKWIGKEVDRLERKVERKSWDLPDVDEYSLQLEVGDGEPAFTDWLVEHYSAALIRLTPAIERRVAELLRETHLASIVDSRSRIADLELAFGLEGKKGL